MISQFEEKDFYEWLGSQFQSIREKKGLKQKEVAEKAGVAAGDLSKFENRGKKLSAYRILLLAQAINCSVDDLIGETKKKLPTSSSMVLARKGRKQERPEPVQPPSRSGLRTPRRSPKASDHSCFYSKTSYETR